MLKAGCLLLLMIPRELIFAAIEVVPFEDAQLKARYQTLTQELRCLVCQNQSLADSEANLAQDLRLLVQQQLLSGASDAEIVDFLVVRYGDFVRYRPPFSGNHILLWLTPFALIVIGLLVWWMRFRKV